MFATLSIVVSTASRLHYALFFEHKKSPETVHVVCATIILGSKIPELHPLYWFVGIWYFFKIAGASPAMTFLQNFPVKNNIKRRLIQGY